MGIIQTAKGLRVSWVVGTDIGQRLLSAGRYVIFVLVNESMNRNFMRGSKLIKYVKIIDDINEYQCGKLPVTAQKLDAPVTLEEMMKKSTPIAVILCAVMFLTMFIKTFTSKSMVVFWPGVLGGFFLGSLLLIVHEWLHAIVYPRQAKVTIGKLKGKMVFVALASFPMKRSRFIIMCLLPFLLGIIPLTLFVVSPPQETVLNGLLFGMACMGMVSPFPDVHNVILVLKQSKDTDEIMFYGDDVYRIP